MKRDYYLDQDYYLDDYFQGQEPYFPGLLYLCSEAYLLTYLFRS